MRDFLSQSHHDDEKIYPRYFYGNNRYERVYDTFEKWKHKNTNGTMEQFFDYVADATFLRELSPELEQYLIWYLGSYVVYRIKKRRIKK